MPHAFLAARDDLARTRWSEQPDPGPLSAGAVLLGVRRFAFTSNNVTYARLGGSMNYWDYFPAPDGWGSIPVWGIAEVLRSEAEGIEPGERVYGFLPMSELLVVRPDRVKPTGFVDAAPHRAALPRTYNEYARIDRDPAYDPATADLHLVLRPLFSLSFFLAEHLKDEAFFGAGRVVIASASSKTALGLAFLLRRAGVRVIGLTGGANAAALAALGSYDAVLAYDAIGELPDEAPAVFVDVAGDARITAAVHRRLGACLRFSSAAGFTRGSDPAAPPPHGPAPELFFTPSHIVARRAEWGPDELRRRLAEAWRAFIADFGPRLTILPGAGRAAVERAYAEVLQGRVPSDRAHVLAFA